MKKVLFFAVLFIFICGVCNAKTIDEARQALAQINLEYNEQVFLQKIQEKDNYAVGLFLDAGMNPNSLGTYGNNPLKYAALFNNIDALKMLLAKDNININVTDSNGKNALDIATSFNNQEIIKILQKKGLKTQFESKYSLDQTQLEHAIDTGKNISSRKEDIIYTEKDTDKTYAHFWGSMQTMGRTYWLTPYCSVASESLVRSKKYEEIKQDTISRLANTCQLRVIFSMTDPNIRYWEDLKIVGLQNGKTVFPYFIEAIPEQKTKDSRGLLRREIYWYRRGYIANFNVHDIDMNKPIQFKVITKSSKELTFRFDNNHGRDQEYWNSEDDAFKW